MLKKEEIISRLSAYFSEKAADYGIDMAFLFGSCARGHLKEESDVDVAVVFKNEGDSNEKKFALVTNVSVELGPLIGTEVEVLPVDKDFRKPALYYNAVVLGAPLYISDKNRFIQLYNQALFQMNDFELFGSRFQLEVSRNILREVLHG